MPCVGPSQAEMGAMEIHECERLYGVRASELDIATRVACHLANGESNDLTKRWIAEHKRRDAEREQQEAESEKRRKIQAELREAEAAIRRKYQD